MMYLEIFCDIITWMIGGLELRLREGRVMLTKKVIKGFREIFIKHKNEFDWYLKADDDTYFFMENLRYF